VSPESARSLLLRSDRGNVSDYRAHLNDYVQHNRSAPGGGDAAPTCSFGGRALGARCPRRSSTWPTNSAPAVQPAATPRIPRTSRAIGGAALGRPNCCVRVCRAALRAEGRPASWPWWHRRNAHPRHRLGGDPWACGRELPDPRAEVIPAVEARACQDADLHLEPGRSGNPDVARAEGQIEAIAVMDVIDVGRITAGCEGRRGPGQHPRQPGCRAP
jgi:hypothetical protein